MKILHLIMICAILALAIRVQMPEEKDDQEAVKPVAKFWVEFLDEPGAFSYVNGHKDQLFFENGQWFIKFDSKNSICRIRDEIYSDANLIEKINEVIEESENEK